MECLTRDAPETEAGRNGRNGRNARVGRTEAASADREIEADPEGTGAAEEAWAEEA